MLEGETGRSKSGMQRFCRGDVEREVEMTAHQNEIRSCDDVEEIYVLTYLSIGDGQLGRGKVEVLLLS